MYGMKLSPNSDGRFPEVENAERVTKHDRGFALYCVHNGTPGGNPAVHIVVTLADGHVIDIETSLRLLGTNIDKCREATGG